MIPKKYTPSWAKSAVKLLGLNIWWGKNQEFLEEKKHSLTEYQRGGEVQRVRYYKSWKSSTHIYRLCAQTPTHTHQSKHVCRHKSYCLIIILLFFFFFFEKSCSQFSVILSSMSVCVRAQLTDRWWVWCSGDIGALTAALQPLLLQGEHPSNSLQCCDARQLLSAPLPPA